MNGYALVKAAYPEEDDVSLGVRRGCDICDSSVECDAVQWSRRWEWYLSCGPAVNSLASYLCGTTGEWHQLLAYGCG